MIELTAGQVAEGFVAHDGTGLPAGLTEGQECEFLERGGVRSRGTFNSRMLICSWHGTSAHKFDRVAYRPLIAAAKTSNIDGDQTNPNAAMLARDARKPLDVDVMAGNGCIFGTPRAERSPLLVVAEIPKTGFSLWGAT